MSCSHPSPSPFPTPQAALLALAEHLSPVGTERIGWHQAGGRVLAVDVASDRPSPACDVSAMDGYAVRVADLSTGRIAVAGRLMIGKPSPPLPPGVAMGIVTGAMIPEGAELVIKREEVRESESHIELKEPTADHRPGQHIRRMGENMPPGKVAMEAGRVLDAAGIGGLVHFGLAHAVVHKPVRVGILTTGDELHEPGAAVAPWQLRDSNGPALCALMDGCGWAKVVAMERAADEPRQALLKAIGRMLDECDALLLTGGVSMGDHDHVPWAIREAGAQVIFHKLPIRPGHPMLGAAGPKGQLVLGLPGNPVSVLATARRLGSIGLRKLAGFGPAGIIEPPPMVRLANADEATLGIWWYRLVRRTGEGLAELVGTKGSGDIGSAARSDGLVELPPGAAGQGPWAFYPWKM